MWDAPGRITSFSETGDGRYLITLTGARRFRILEEIETDAPYRSARVDWSAYEIDAHADGSADEVDRDLLLDIMRDYLEIEGLKG